ncbi:MAG: hypothetical protein EOO92_25010, partial [Pedobacter sp.]
MVKPDIIFKYFKDLTPTQVEQFEQLFDLYSLWNSQINVISRKDIEELYERHILHSLGVAKFCTFKPGEKVVLSRGDQNHNLKRWTEVDLILHKEGLKDLAPKDVYIGPDEQVCMIPVIIVTDGEKARTHKQQVFLEFHRLRIS